MLAVVHVNMCQHTSSHVRHNEKHEALLVLRRYERRAALFEAVEDEDIQASAVETLQRVVELLQDVEPAFFG